MIGTPGSADDVVAMPERRRDGRAGGGFPDLRGAVFAEGEDHFPIGAELGGVHFQLILQAGGGQAVMFSTPAQRGAEALQRGDEVGDVANCNLLHGARVAVANVTRAFQPVIRNDHQPGKAVSHSVTSFDSIQQRVPPAIEGAAEADEDGE